jgi:hypothetical protein
VIVFQHPLPPPTRPDLGGTLVDLFSGLGTWAGAIASFLAVAVALVVAFWQVFDRRNERRRAQAAQISVWTEFRPRKFDPMDLVEIAHIMNASSEAIFDTVITTGIVNKGDQPLLRGEDGHSVWVGTVAPGHWVTTMPLQHDQAAGMSAVLGLGITFVDTNGRTWQRTASGRLRPVEGEPLVVLGLSRSFSHVSRPTRVS